MCSDSDKEPPNENNGVSKQIVNKPNGTMNHNQRQRQKQQKKKILPQLQDALNEKRQLLALLIDDKISQKDFNNDKHFSFEIILTENFKDYLNPQQLKGVQIENQVTQINNLLMYPYIISHEQLLEKRYLISSLQHLLELLKNQNENRKLNFSTKYEICLNQLQTKFPELARRIKQVMRNLKDFHFQRGQSEDIEQRVIKQIQQRQIKLENKSKPHLALIKLQQLNLIVISTAQNPKQNKQEVNLQFVIIGLENQVKSLKQKILTKEHQQNKLKKQIVALNSINQKYKAQLQNKQQQINSLRLKENDLNLDLQAKIKIIDNLTAQNQQHLKLIEELNNQLVVQKQKNTIFTQQKQNQQKQKRELEFQLSYLKDRLQKQKQQNKAIHQKAQLQLAELVKQRDQLKTANSDSFYVLKMAKLFAGQILQTRKKEKAFLIQSIEKHMKRQIEKTKLLFDTKKDYNVVNYHDRIDGKQNLVLILQTKKAIIAAYYSGKYLEKTYMTQEGLILSLNNRKYYRLNNSINFPKKKQKDVKTVYGMVYDKYFLIVGNAEIRLKPGQKERKVFSNFGISNSYFNSEGDNVSHLLCEDKINEVEVIDYQIYQAFLGQIEDQKSQKNTNKQPIAENPYGNDRFEEEVKEQVKQIEEVQINRYQILAKNLEEECARKDNDIIQLTREINQFKSTKEELTKQNQRLTSDMECIQKEFERIKFQVLNLHQTLDNKQISIYSMKQQIQEYVRLSSVAEQKFMEINSQLQKIKRLNSQFQGHNKQLKGKILSLQVQIQELKQTQVFKEQPISENNLVRQDQHKSEEINLNNSLSQMNLSEQSVIKSKLCQALTNCESYKLQKQNQSKEIQNLKIQLQHQKSIFQQRGQQMQQLMKMKFTLQQQKDQLLKTIESNNIEMEGLRYRLLMLQEQNLRLKSRQQEKQDLRYRLLMLQEQNLRLKSSQSEINQLKKLNMELQQTLSFQKEKHTRLRTLSFVQHATLFSGDILQKKKEQKRFLIDSIQRHMKKTIQKTKIVFDSIKDSKVPFHQRLDNKQNLVMIVQTQKALIAGYYSGRYMENVSMTEESLIISLTNKKYYRLNNSINFPKKNKKETKPMLGMIYDRFYIIFGNAQLRIKPTQIPLKFFSNFGVSNAYFNNEGDNLNALLCEGKKNQVPIISFQVYEVAFLDVELIYQN